MEIDEIMTRDEMEARFESEWVLINDPVLDEENRIISGRVRFHSPDKAAMHEAVKRLGSDFIATEFMGTPPVGMQFML